MNASTPLQWIRKGEEKKFAQFSHEFFHVQHSIRSLKMLEDNHQLDLEMMKKRSRNMNLPFCFVQNWRSHTDRVHYLNLFSLMHAIEFFRTSHLLVMCSQILRCDALILILIFFFFFFFATGERWQTELGFHLSFMPRRARSQRHNNSKTKRNFADESNKMHVLFTIEIK